MKNIFIASFILLIFSCSLGLDDGSDLVGKWKLTQIGLMSDLSYTLFNSDNTGKDVYYMGMDVESNFTWRVTKGDYYNIIEYKCDPTSDSVSQDEYYFSADKKYLYLREKGKDDYWISYIKE